MEPFDNSFWEKSKCGRRERERNNTFNSGHHSGQLKALFISVKRSMGVSENPWATFIQPPLGNAARGQKAKGCLQKTFLDLWWIVPELWIKERKC